MYPPQGKPLYKLLRQSELRTTLLRCPAGKQGCRAKSHFTWTFFFYLYTQVFASRFLEAACKWCIPSTRLARSKGMVGKNEFATPSSDDFEMILTNQIFELLEPWQVSYEIVALRVEPKSLESRVINEDVRSARCIRAVFQIEITPIQNQDVSLYIKRYGRQSPVIMVHDQLSLRRFQ